MFWLHYMLWVGRVLSVGLGVAGTIAWIVLARKYAAYRPTTGQVLDAKAAMRWRPGLGVYSYRECDIAYADTEGKRKVLRGVLLVRGEPGDEVPLLIGPSGEVQFAELWQRRYLPVFHCLLWAVLLSWMWAFWPS